MLGRLRCALRLHSWERRVNQDENGRGAPYTACRRCGTEKNEYGPPTRGQATGMGGIGGAG